MHEIEIQIAAETVYYATTVRANKDIRTHGKYKHVNQTILSQFPSDAPKSIDTGAKQNTM